MIQLGTCISVCLTAVSLYCLQQENTVPGCWLYILRCRDGSYYTGTTRHADPETRLGEHQAGASPGAYTFTRRPVEMVFVEFFPLALDAIAAERQVKGWSRAKKEALIGRRFDLLPELSRSGRKLDHPSTGSG